MTVGWYSGSPVYWCWGALNNFNGQCLFLPFASDRFLVGMNLPISLAVRIVKSLDFLNDPECEHTHTGKHTTLDVDFLQHS